MDRNKQKVEDLVRAVERGVYGDLITLDRLFYRAFLDKPEVGMLMMNLLRYILSPGVWTQTYGGETAYVVHSGVWTAVYNTRGTHDVPRRRLKKLVTQYGLIRTKGCRYTPNDQKGTAVFVNWKPLLERLEETREFLVANYGELELALLGNGGTLIPVVVPVVPFELIIKRALQSHYSSSPEETLAALADFVRYGGSTTIEDVFRHHGFLNLKLEMEEIQYLDLNPSRWRFKARTAEALRPFRNLLKAQYVAFDNPNAVEHRFGEGHLDLLVAQFTGVALTVYRNTVDLQPRDFRDAVFNPQFYMARCRAAFEAANQKFSPLETLVMDEGLRLGWIESRTLGKGKHYKNIFTELLTEEDYRHLDHVQCLGIFAKLFPGADSLFKQFVPLSQQLRPENIKEDMKPLYQALYPGLLQRLEDLSGKHADTG